MNNKMKIKPSRNAWSVEEENKLLELVKKNGLNIDKIREELTNFNKVEKRQNLGIMYRLIYLFRNICKKNAEDDILLMSQEITNKFKLKKGEYENFAKLFTDKRDEYNKKMELDKQKQKEKTERKRETRKIKKLTNYKIEHKIDQIMQHQIYLEKLITNLYLGENERENLISLKQNFDFEIQNIKKNYVEQLNKYETLNNFKDKEETSDHDNENNKNDDESNDSDNDSCDSNSDNDDEKVNVNKEFMFDIDKLLKVSNVKSFESPKPVALTLEEKKKLLKRNKET